MRRDQVPPVSNVSYTLRRAFWFVWRWQTDYDWGARSDTGLAVGRPEARRKARVRLREMRADKCTAQRAAYPGETPHGG